MTEKDDIIKVISDTVETANEIVNEKEEETAKDILNRYTEIDLEIQKVRIQQSDFMLAHADIFDKFNQMNAKIEEFKKDQDKVQEELLTKMRETNLPEESNNRFKAKYTAPSIRKNFDTKKFYEDYKENTAMYKKYVGITNVKDSIKISEVK